MLGSIRHDIGIYLDQAVCPMTHMSLQLGFDLSPYAGLTGLQALNDFEVGLAVARGLQPPGPP